MLPVGSLVVDLFILKLGVIIENERVCGIVVISCLRQFKLEYSVDSFSSFGMTRLFSSMMEEPLSTT